MKERLVREAPALHPRKSRERSGTSECPCGFTNAGKSTLFNTLVKARAYAADQLFATLDTTTRQLYLEDAGRTASLSDTVGFIRDLPHKLVDAFEATLQEAAEADLLLHVVDAASPVLDEQIAEVQRVLRDIGAADIPQILVYTSYIRRIPASGGWRATSDLRWVRVRVFCECLRHRGPNCGATFGCWHREAPVDLNDAVRPHLCLAEASGHSDSLHKTI